MSFGNVWIGHKLSRRMPLVNWQRWQEIGFYLSTLCEFCFRFGFRFWLRFIFRFLFISYATCKLTAAMCFAVQIQQLIAAVRCTPYFLLLYSLYSISNFFWNIQECSLLCVQFLHVVCTVYTCTRYTLQHSVQSLQCTTIPCKPVHWWGNVTCAVPRGSGKHVVCTHVPEHKNLAVVAVVAAVVAVVAAVALQTEVCIDSVPE